MSALHEAARLPHPLTSLIRPRVVTVVGASSDATRIGGRPIAMMLKAGFHGEIYPINPARPEVQGLRAYASVADLPAVPDAALIAVPGHQVLQTVDELGRRGVRAAIIFSAGFAETGEAGIASQAAVVQMARRHGMRLLGPNCLGLFNAGIGWYPTFTTAFEQGWPVPGRVGVVSQSGAFGSNLVTLARNRGIGTPIGVTTGNECDITVGEIIHGFAEDPDIDVIMAYMEGIKEGDSLVAALECARRAHKPVIAMKVGRSMLGSSAAQSHTASVAGDDAVTDAVLAEFGVVRARSAEQLLDIAYLATRRIYPVGNSLGVITVSGGAGVLISDVAEDEALAMPPMPEASQAKLKALVPYSSPRNPVDCTAQAINDLSLVSSFTREMFGAGGYKSVLGFFAQMAGAQSVAHRLQEDLIAAHAPYRDRLFALAGTMPAEVIRRYDEAGIAIFEDPTRATVAISAMGRFGDSFARPERSPPPHVDPVPLPRATPSEAEAKQLLARAGIAIAPERSCATAEAAADAAQALGFPVVMKILSPDILHKTEIGGVLLDVSSREEAASGFDRLIERARIAAPEARIEGVLVARQMRGGVECILGIHRDPVFGPVAVFGLGGIFVEVLQDVVLRRCPFGEAEAREMITSIRAARILQGARNQPPSDIAALARMLSRLSVFAHQAGPRLEAVDLNPVIVLPEGQGAYALDALLQVTPPSLHAV
ncbi:MAG: acetate--CoA ligase family protein [Variovorax sp.]|nr:acetate--CoA ligase family protein [Variovorax sp.]